MTEILGAAYNGMFLLFLLAVVAALLRSPLVKGWFGEAQSALAQELLLDKAIYTAINDITLPTTNGTTQIDHVVVSRYGIFVVETKNMKGWIYGSEKGATWTQNLYGRKYRFQNPLHQNYRHVRALGEFLKLDDSHFHSVVMFWGNATLKNPLPPNVMTHGYASYIKSKQRVLFSDEEVAAIISAIQTGRLPRTWATRKAHVESLKARHSSTDICPKCSKPLVLRTANSGANAGRTFYGCTAYPACRYMRWP